ncbi:unnamed protein product [Danaus chrysippus]|uniref:(African queen) hypothetical protein n=1 Tax=Danaus chrysippus TaxID=151541 RepID=A0A8J2QSW5_9NEOP|nr:unnamed protein product [Danaus chrysippus]
MDPKLWLLVEYVEDKSAFSNYGVINTNNIIQHEADLNNGNAIFVRDKNNGALKDQVLRISESKRYVKDFKITLERQDNQVKNVVTLCMNTIKETKTGQLLLDHQEGRSLNALNRTCKLQNKLKRVRVIAIVMKSASKVMVLYGLERSESPQKKKISTQNLHSPSTSPKAKTIAERKSWKLSPGRKNRKTSPVPNAKITYNVASQTNIVVDIPNKEKMGKVIKELHSKIEVLEAELQTREPETLSVPEATRTND